MPEFPSEFLEFVEANVIDLEEYKVRIPRFIRITEPIAQIRESFYPTELAATNLDDFYSLDSGTKIKNNKYYDNGVYGMDISSGICCYLLEVKPDDHVLDLCCAPGSKTRYLCDIMGDGLGTVTGVDFSMPRLSIAKRLLMKCGFDRWRLFCMDGTLFDVRPPTRIGKHVSDFHKPTVKASGDVLNAKEVQSSAETKVEDKPSSRKRKRPEGTIDPFHATRLLRSDPQYNQPKNLYDKVLVDAECTHDGSISHLDKYIQSDWKDFQKQFLDPVRLSSLSTLQKGLIKNGFRLLKRGGVLIYSTCSFCKSQNEDIVDWLLSECPDAVLLDIELNVNRAPLKTAGLKSNLEKCLRLSPKHSNTSGFFIAKLTKK